MLYQNNDEHSMSSLSLFFLLIRPAATDLPAVEVGSKAGDPEPIILLADFLYILVLVATYLLSLVISFCWVPMHDDITVNTVVALTNRTMSR